MDWQSCEVSKPFDPLLLDMMMDALCSYHFSDLLVLGIMSLLVLLTAFLKHLISQVVILRSRGLVMVQVWHWYVSVGTKMEFMICYLSPLGYQNGLVVVDSKQVKKKTTTNCPVIFPEIFHTSGGVNLLLSFSVLFCCCCCCCLCCWWCWWCFLFVLLLWMLLLFLFYFVSFTTCI